MSTKYRIQKFWKYFETIQQELEHALQTQDHVELVHRLEDINHRLTSICGCKMEIEMSETGFYEMTFATGGDKTAQLCAAVLKKDAPVQMSEKWILNAFRKPFSERALHSVFEIKGKQYSGADFQIYYTIVEETKTLAIKVYCEGLVEIDEAQRDSIVATMLELFLGELELEARIGQIEIVNTPSTEGNVCLLPNLYEDICDIIVDKDWIEYHDPLAIYMVYKLDKKPASEALRKDMLLIVTTNPQLYEELLRKQYDTCKDFSDKGGEYGYIYYEVLYDDEKEALVRQQLEKEIQELLYPLSIARTMGGAIGVHYSYIDLAIFDRDAFAIAIHKMNEKMRFKLYYKAFLES